mmetsp:Transcript_54667/g.160800  ORF Transcript_54667/g.160800 Transcript_54667/m.160800 type:complete len:312 (-) Transcript_54667:294-1229(-)
MRMRSIALARMCCIARWSVTSSWNSLFSCSRSSLAFFTSILVLAISSWAAPISSASFEIWSSRELIWSLRSLMTWLVSYLSFSLTLNSSVQNAFLVTSSACCFFSSTTMSSMAFFTFVKASSWTEAARSAMAGAPVRLASFWSRTETVLRFAAVEADSVVSSLMVTADTWTKEFTVLSKFAKASSSLRILMVSSTADISVRRLFVRASISASAAAHFVPRFARNSWSRASWARTSSSSFVSSAAFSPRPARSASVWTSFSSPALISSCLADRRAVNSSTACASDFCASERLASNCSCICFRMPKIWPLWGA